MTRYKSFPESINLHNSSIMLKWLGVIISKDSKVINTTWTKGSDLHSSRHVVGSKLVYKFTDFSETEQHVFDILLDCREWWDGWITASVYWGWTQCGGWPWHKSYLGSGRPSFFLTVDWTHQWTEIMPFVQSLMAQLLVQTVAVDNAKMRLSHFLLALYWHVLQKLITRYYNGALCFKQNLCTT